MAVTEHRAWTHEALVAEGLDPERYEIAKGELVEVHEVGFQGGRLFARLATALTHHVETNRLGVICIAGRFLLAESPRLERRPDLAFVSTSRLPDPPDPDLYPGAPDLAIEILSPSDPSGAVADKAEEYLAHGSRESWVVDPKMKTIFVMRAGRPPRPHGVGDVLESPEILPGFRLLLEDFFAPAPRA